ncbi:unnamed protein product [Porites lobata]|uniref:DUF7869 domain-containing protein n=1 Tax=Porites lobata TaxID=104759 RepID=A0ABN8SFG4_9CNID|nr:unnamed protein product [Porites lobata]
MDINFFDDCGLEGHDHLHYELAQVRSEYLAADVEQIHPCEPTSSEDSEVTAALNSTESTLDSVDCTPQRNKDDTTLDQDQDYDDFTTPIKSFLERGCDCRYGRNQSSCTKSLDFDEVVDHRMQCIELSSVELDLIVLGALQSHFSRSKEKKRIRMNYFFRDIQVCKKTFLFVYGIGKSRLENLKAHFKRDGIVPRTHANTSRLPKNTLNHEVLDRTVTFIKNFAAEQAVSLPGRYPKFKDFKVQLLPSSESKASLWRRYKKASEDKNLSAVSYTKFVDLWNSLTPYIVIMKPASDLCSLCQLNNGKIAANVNVSEQEKLNCLHNQEKHLQEAKLEREFMKKNIAECKDLEYPGRSITSLTTTISYVHDFFISHGAGETNAQINADNCGAQNKNNFFIWYYSWRILCGLHKSILYSFLIAGHTKFSPDWCFGLLKQSFRRHYVSSLFDLMSAVDKSTVSGVNISKLCGLHDGTLLVPVYDWVTFLEPYYKKIPGISTFHHFRFSKDHPGVVFCRTLVDSPEIEFQILKNLEIRPPNQLPPKIVPSGLGEERKRYLYREIREFCRPGTEDMVAPAP